MTLYGAPRGTISTAQIEPADGARIVIGVGHFELGPWTAMSVAEIGDLLRDSPFRWWIGGGRALELHLGRTWRDHADTDIGILRRDVGALAVELDGWDLHVAAAGRLTSWRGQPLDAARHENNLWCRRQPAGPWELDVLLGPGDEEAWAFRRDHRVRIHWDDAVLHTADGVPYLAPDLQLLFKSRNPRGKDTLDLRQVAPELDPPRRRRLLGLLPVDHPWRPLLADR